MRELKIAPSEAWLLDYAEIKNLADVKDADDIDLSIMLNFERVKNGADLNWLHRK